MELSLWRLSRGGATRAEGCCTALCVLCSRNCSASELEAVVSLFWLRTSGRCGVSKTVKMSLLRSGFLKRIYRNDYCTANCELYYPSHEPDSIHPQTPPHKDDPRQLFDKLLEHDDIV